MDWGSGAKWPYEQAAGNGFLVGAELAALLTYIRDHAHVKLSDVHIIGHSLGAQVAGLAGHSLTKIGRITGMREDISHLYISPFLLALKLVYFRSDFSINSFYFVFYRP